MADRTDFAFDALDRKIVDLRKANGRISNQEIAERFKVTRASVGLFDSREEIGAITSDLLEGVPGVLDVQVSIVTRSIKYNERIAKL